MSETLAQDINELIWQELSSLETYDGGKRHRFALGLPVYYSEDDTPAGLVIREFADGRRELVKRGQGSDMVVRPL